MDTSDGLAAGVERRLIAMADSRVGASGVLALVMLLFLEMAALIRLGSSAPIALLLAGFWARVAPLWAIGRFDYLRPEGSAAFHRRHGRFFWMQCRLCWLCLCSCGSQTPFRSWRVCRSPSCVPSDLDDGLAAIPVTPTELRWC